MPSGSRRCEPTTAASATASLFSFIHSKIPDYNVPFTCDRSDLLQPADVPDFAGCPARYFNSLTAEYVLPERITDAEVMETLGERMFMDADFRPTEATPYALACWRIVAAKKKPPKRATDFGEHPLFPSEVEELTGFSMSQLGNVAGRLVTTEEYLLRSAIIAQVEEELASGAVIVNGFANRSHKLASKIYGVRPVQPTAAFAGQVEWSRAVNAAVVANARTGYSKREVIEAPWLDGGEMEREAFGRTYADMLLIHPDARLPNELDERGRYIGHALYTEAKEAA